MVKASTPVCVWDTLRKAGFKTIATKPLYESKLQRLLHTMAGTEPEHPAETDSGHPLGSPGESSGQGDAPGAVPAGSVPGDEAEWVDSPEASARERRAGSGAAAGRRSATEGLVIDVGRRPEGMIPPSTAKWEGPSPPLKGRLILVAEDNDLLRKLAVQAMAKLGARTVAVENGQLAVDEIGRRAAAGEGRFDFVLMDFMVRRSYSR